MEVYDELSVIKWLSYCKYDVDYIRAVKCHYRLCILQNVCTAI